MFGSGDLCKSIFVFGIWLVTGIGSHFACSWFAFVVQHHFPRWNRYIVITVRPCRLVRQVLEGARGGFRISPWRNQIERRSSWSIQVTYRRQYLGGILWWRWSNRHNCRWETNVRQIYLVNRVLYASTVPKCRFRDTLCENLAYSPGVLKSDRALWQCWATLCWRESSSSCCSSAEYFRDIPHSFPSWTNVVVVVRSSDLRSSRRVQFLQLLYIHLNNLCDCEVLETLVPLHHVESRNISDVKFSIHASTTLDHTKLNRAKLYYKISSLFQCIVLITKLIIVLTFSVNMVRSFLEQQAIFINGLTSLNNFRALKHSPSFSHWIH